MVEQFIAYFFTQGPFGVLFIGAVLIGGFFVKLWRDEVKAHIQDLKDVQKSMAEPLSKLQETSNTIITKTEQTNSILLSFFSKGK